MTMPPTEQDSIATVTHLLTLQMQPFVTPISGMLPDRTGKLVGTGGYIEWNKKRFLLTNEHVAREIGKHSLARKCYDSSDYIHVNNQFYVMSTPEDLAVSPVDDRWTDNYHSAMTFPQHRFADKHEPVEKELLFVMGFTGEKSRYVPSFDTLVTRGTPYLTQQYHEALEPLETRRPVSHSDFNPAVHFAMHWQPEATVSTDAKQSSIPSDPHGMSGSFVWNTRFVEFAQREEPWTPGVARLTGILWGWDTSDRFLFATRIEYAAAFLASLHL